MGERDFQAAYGAIVIDQTGRVLVREVAGSHDGYRHSFSHGHRAPDETPKETACRMTLAQTGWSVEIVDRIPGAFWSGNGKAIYFLARPIEQVSDSGWKTSGVSFVAPDRAMAMLQQTTNKTGRERDVAALRGAYTLIGIPLAGRGPAFKAPPRKKPVEDYEPLPDWIPF